MARQHKDIPVKQNSVGRIVSNISYKVVDIDTQHTVGVNEPGELLLKYVLVFS